MLKKCLKYDLRANYKKWLILSLIALSFSVIGSLFFCTSATAGEESAIIDVICSVICALSFLVVAFYPIAVLTITSERCYKSFFTDEGYLTFSLPIPRKTLYLSKVLSAALWDAAFFLLALILVVLWVAIVGGGSWAFVESLFIHYFVEMNPVLSAIGLLLLPLLLVAVDFFHINMIYALAGSAAGYAGKRVNPGRIVLVAVLLYYVLPAIEGGFLIPVIIISIAIADVAAGKYN